MGKEGDIKVILDVLEKKKRVLRLTRHRLIVSIQDDQQSENLQKGRTAFGGWMESRRLFFFSFLFPFRRLSSLKLMQVFAMYM